MIEQADLVKQAKDGRFTRYRYTTRYEARDGTYIACMRPDVFALSMTRMEVDGRIFKLQMPEAGGLKVTEHDSENKEIRELDGDEAEKLLADTLEKLKYLPPLQNEHVRCGSRGLIRVDTENRATYHKGPGR